MTKLIWTQKAVDRWMEGKSDPRHTISAPNIADVYDGYVRQFRPGTAWLLVDDDAHAIIDGTIPR